MQKCQLELFCKHNNFRNTYLAEWQSRLLLEIIGDIGFEGCETSRREGIQQFIIIIIIIIIIIYQYFYRIYPFSRADFKRGPDKLKLYAWEYNKIGKCTVRGILDKWTIQQNYKITVLSVSLNWGKDLHWSAESGSSS